MSPALATLFERWLAEAEPGAIFVYCRGQLALDRVDDPALGKLADRIQSLSTGQWDQVSRCGHVRGRVVGTRILEISTRRERGETAYLAKKRHPEHER